MFDCLPSACRRQAKIEYIYTQTCEDSHSKDMDKAKDMEKIMVTAVVVTCKGRNGWRGHDTHGGVSHRFHGGDPQISQVHADEILSFSHGGHGYIT